MARYRTRNRIFLSKVEATPGVDAAPDVANDAILCENPQPTPNFEVLQTNEVTGSLDGRGPIVGGGFFGFTLDVLMKGAGAAGAAPEYSDLLRAAAMAETLTAAPVADTAQAGAADSITLHAGASATDDAYKGMVIALTGGAGNGQRRVIAAYDGATKIASTHPDWTTPPDITTDFSIDANALYVPASASLETMSGYLYDNASQAGTDSLLRKLIAAAATFTIEITTRQIGRLSFTLRGILPELPSNVAAPGTPTYDATRPPPFINADAFLGGQAVKFRTLSLDYGATVQQADDPAAVYGFDIAGVTERRITGTINPVLELLSSRNAFADFTTGTRRPLWLRWGTTAGNRISLYLPEVHYTGADPSDIDGYNAESLPFEAVGNDSGLYLSLY